MQTRALSGQLHESVMLRQLFGKSSIPSDAAISATAGESAVAATALLDTFDSKKVRNFVDAVRDEQATELHEQARRRVARFIGARSEREIVFTRGTTESLNLVAFSFGEACMSEGDEIILTTMEHHSNIVPWQMLRDRRGIVIRVVPIDDRGVLDLEALEHLFTGRTRLVAVTHVSNVLGTVNPVEAITTMAHAHGVPVLVDGAQSVPHFPIDVEAIGCDFLTFSGHKVYGPTGIGVLYGREEWLDRLPPYQGGGEMISHVSFERTTYEQLPYKFEAGTPDYVGSAALAQALDYVDDLGRDCIRAHERDLTRYAMERLGHTPSDLSESDDMHLPRPVHDINHQHHPPLRAIDGKLYALACGNGPDGGLDGLVLDMMAAYGADMASILPDQHAAACTRHDALHCGYRHHCEGLIAPLHGGRSLKDLIRHTFCPP